MAPKLQIKRGLKKDLPTLASGEFGLCEDTGELFVGTQSGNLPVVSAAGAGDMLKSVYDADNDGVVDKAESVSWAGVTGKPATFAPSSHNHTKSQITDMPASLPANGGNADTVDGKHASEFATAAQGAKADAAVPATRKINGKALSADISLAAADVGALASSGKAVSASSADAVAWGNVTGKPSTFSPSSHTHDDRYYTESEMNTKLNGKANTSGTYANLSVGSATRAASGDFYFGKGHLYSRDLQYMEIWPGNEVLYKLVYGIVDSNWAMCNAGNGTTRLGSPGSRWRELWAANGTIQTSDRNAKNMITELAENSLRLLERLKPVSYRMNDGTSGRTHYGFIAQDVEDAMAHLGMSSLDFAGLCKDQRKALYQVITTEPLLDEMDGDLLGAKETLKDEWRPVCDENGAPVYDYSLRYDEFMPLAVLGAQEALRRTETLEAENKQLKEALAALTDRVAALEKGA